MAWKRLNEAVQQQAKWYDARHKPVSHREVDLVLLSTANLQVRGTSTKLKRKFAGPFRITECIGSQSYKLDLPMTWRVHNVFHVSLLKIWHEDMYRRYPTYVLWMYLLVVDCHIKWQGLQVCRSNWHCWILHSPIY